MTLATVYGRSASPGVAVAPAFVIAPRRTEVTTGPPAADPAVEHGRLDRALAQASARLEALAERLTPLFGPSPVQIVPRRRGSYELQVGFHDLTALTSAVARLSAGSDGTT